MGSGNVINYRYYHFEDRHQLSQICLLNSIFVVKRYCFFADATSNSTNSAQQPTEDERNMDSTNRAKTTAKKRKKQPISFEKLNKELDKVSGMTENKRKSIYMKAANKIIEMINTDRPSLPDGDHERIKNLRKFKVCVRKIIELCRSYELTNLALTLLKFQLETVNQSYKKDPKLEELGQLGITLEKTAEVMSKLKNEENFKKIKDLLEEILTEMQSEKTVDLKIKCSKVSMFLNNYGNCCFSMGDFHNAIVTSRQAENLIKTVLPNDAAHHKILAYCYKNLAKSSIRVKDKRTARDCLRKAKDIVATVTDWNKNEKALILSSLEQVEKDAQDGLEHVDDAQNGQVCGGEGNGVALTTTLIE